MTDPHPPTVAFVSLGCAKNLVDTERMLAGLALGGFALTDEPDGADVAVVNTCAFIDLARAESDEHLDELEALKRAGRLGRVVVAGCMAQRYGRQVLARHPEVDAVVGLAGRDALARACQAALARGPETPPLVTVEPLPPAPPSDRERLRLTPRHYAYLRISEGCDNRCAYCVIPSIRGPLRSKPPEAVLAEAEELVADGARELILIGQDTTAYGRDLGGGWTLARLLGALRRGSGAEWLRLLYMHPASLTDDVIGELAAGRPLVPYADLPLQHADDAVLAAMGRHTSRAEIDALIARLREAVPGIALRTTFIVGHPGETEAAFDRLVRFVEEVRFDHVGVFLYSPEAGTPAAALPGAVPAETARRRWDRLMRLADERAREAARARVGDELTVLVDGPAPLEGALAGHHAGQAPEVDAGVLIPEEDAAPGDAVRVRVTGTDGLDLAAEVLGPGDLTR